MFEKDDRVPTIDIYVPDKKLKFRNTDYRMGYSYRKKFFKKINNFIREGNLNSEEGLVNLKNKIRTLLVEAIEKNEIYKLSEHKKKMEKIRTESKNVTRGRLNKMLKWFKGKKVKTEYFYSNSLGWNKERKDSGIIKDFNIIGQTQYDYYPYSIEIIFKDHSLIQTIPRDAYFNGLGVIHWVNSGPICSFTITEIKEETNEQ